MHKSSMRKQIFVVFCRSNLTRPTTYRSLPGAINKAKSSPTLEYSRFKSEKDAEQFMHPKIIDYLEVRDQFRKKGVDLEKRQKETKEGLVKEIKKNKGNMGTMPISASIQKGVLDIYRQIQRMDLEEGSKNVAWLIAAFPVSKQEESDLTDVVKAKDHEKEGSLLKTLSQFQLLEKKIIIQKVQAIQIDQTSKGKQKQKQFSGHSNPEVVVTFRIDEFLSEGDHLLNRKIKQIFEELQGFRGDQHDYLTVPQPQRKINKFQNYVAFIGEHVAPNSGKAAISYIVSTAKGKPVMIHKLLIGTQSLQLAEFISLLMCLIDCYSNGVRRMQLFLDNPTLINAIENKDKTQIKQQRVGAKLFVIKKILSKMSEFSVKPLDKRLNYKANDLALTLFKNRK